MQNRDNMSMDEWCNYLGIVEYEEDVTSDEDVEGENAYVEL